MFKCYHQLEHSDCGLTCVRMIARRYGKKIPVQYLKSITDLNRLGMTIMDIEECCKEINLDCCAVKINIDQLNRAPLPLILFWQQNHFVVLYKIKNGKYYIADPSQGKIAYNENEIKEYWLPRKISHGLAILAEPNEKFGTTTYPRNDSNRNFITYIISYLKKYKRYHLIFILVALLISGADIAVPLLMKQSVDDGIGNRDIQLIFILLLMQLAIAIGGLAGTSIVQLFFTRNGMNMYSEMVRSFLNKLSRLPISFFDRKVSSDFIQKIYDHDRIKDFILTFPGGILVSLLSLCVFSFLLFSYSNIIFFIFLFFSLAEIAWNLCFLQRRKAIDYAYFIHSSDNNNHAYELAHGMADLKVNNAENIRIAKWEESQGKVNNLKVKATRLNLIQEGGGTILSRIKDLTVTGIGAVLVIRGDLTLGALMTLGYITGRLAQPFASVSKSMMSYQNALLAHQRVQEIMTDYDSDRGNGKFTIPTMEFKNVWFKYAGSGSPYVIKDFSLKINKGQTVALVGESGCGKSTLIKLMLGFYMPQKGEIILSGKPVSDIDNADWLRHCGVVMQEPRIFSGTILENISMSETVPNINLVLEAIKKAGLSDFISTLPMGINTRIGTSGIEMSGGQKQRMMIARAIYKSPDILFLDEATSSLDANNERAILSTLLDKKGNTTVVVAAHRLSTVRNADRILFIKNGEIYEQGTHPELLSLKGDYWKLIKNQLQISD